MFWNQPLIAIDIGSSSVKLCELKRGHKVLKQIGLEVYPSETVSEGEIKEPDIIKTTIEMMLRKMKIQTRGRRAAISLGGRGVLVKRTLITPEQGSDIYEQASYEASQMLPQDSDDFYLRFTEAGKPTKDGRIPMVLVGARREFVEQHISIVKECGLKIGVIDIGPLSIANMFDHNYPVGGALVIIANVGASCTEVILMFNGDFLFSREIPIGGRAYNQRIMESLGVDSENAENLKLSASLGDRSVSESLVDAMNSINDELSREIQMTIDQFFENEESPDGLNRKGYLFLVGGAACSMGLDTALATTLQMPVQIANPFQRIDCRKSPYKLDYLLTQGVLYGTSIGLALRSFQDSKG